jgi:endonuclease YncB( thermonuclease family)
VAEWTVHGTVKRVIDGDSCVLDLDLGWQIWLVNRVIRLAHMNAPETATDAGKAAKAFAATLLPVDAPVQVVSHSLDKYGRVLASLTLPDGRDFAATMIASGNAVAYEGGPR